METQPNYLNRKLTDEEMVTRLRNFPASRACREAAERIEELTGHRYPKPSDVERFDRAAADRQQKPQT